MCAVDVSAPGGSCFQEYIDSMQSIRLYLIPVCRMQSMGLYRKDVSMQTLRRIIREL